MIYWFTENCWCLPAGQAGTSNGGIIQQIQCSGGQVINIS